jgi:hypothetical protein
MLVSLTVRCDWPGCSAEVSVPNVPQAESKAGWKAENDGRFLLHLCPKLKRHNWLAVREAISDALPRSQSTP